MQGAYLRTLGVFLAPLHVYRRLLKENPKKSFGGLLFARKIFYGNVRDPTITSSLRGRARVGKRLSSQAVGVPCSHSIRSQV